MNPPEGSAEEGGAADSDVDAFFRTGKLGRALGARGRAAAWDAACRTSLGKEGCCWGVRVGGQSSSSGWSCRDSCCYGNAACVLGRGGGWEPGTPRRSPHLRESVLGRREAVALAAFSRGAGMGRSWITLQRAALLPASPAPPSASSLPQRLSASLRPPWAGTPSPAGGPGP